MTVICTICGFDFNSQECKHSLYDLRGKEIEVLQAKLDIAVEAIEQAIIQIRNDNTGYIDSVGAYQLLQEALKKLEEK